MPDELKFAVMRLRTEMDVLGQAVPIGNCAGVIAVFDTQKEAEEDSDGGKYQVVPVRIPEVLNG